MDSRPNPFAYRKPITLDTLGDLFDHHYRLTGGWVMEDPPTPPAPPVPPVPTPPAYAPPATQADLDRIIGERLAREREKYADYTDLKAKAEAHDKALADAMSEQEKAVAKARDEGKAEVQEAANQRLVRAEARVMAATAKFRDPADAVAFLDLSKVEVNDSGEVDAKAITDQLKTLAETKPYLVDDGKKPPPRSDPSQGGGGGEDSPSVSRGREMFESRRSTKKTTAST